MHASEMQHQTRAESGFHETEADLPDTKTDASSRTTDLLSHLGTLNPLPIDITGNDTVWLLDNTAFRSPQTGNWQAEFVAAVFAKESSCRVVDAVANVADKVGLEKDDASIATIEKRMMPFVQDILPGRLVKAIHAEVENLELGPGGRNAISSDLKNLPDSLSGKIVPTVADVPEDTNGLLEMKTFFAEPEGWGLISGRHHEHNLRCTC